jgi:hypothetical protein
MASGHVERGLCGLGGARDTRVGRACGVLPRRRHRLQPRSVLVHTHTHTSMCCVFESGGRPAQRGMVIGRGSNDVRACPLMCPRTALLRLLVDVCGAYGLPGTDGGARSNLWRFVSNNHPTMSILFAHPRHPFTRSSPKGVTHASEKHHPLKATTHTHTHTHTHTRTGPSAWWCC